MNRKSRIAALCITLLVAILTWVVLVSTYLNFTPLSERSAHQWPPVDSAELLFADEFVAAGNVTEPDATDDPAPVAESAPAPEAHDMVDAGEKAEVAPPVVTTKQPSPAKIVEKKPVEKKKTGPTKEELAAIAKAKQEKETSQNISNRVNFGKKAAGGEGSGTPASASTSDNSGSRSGSASGKLGGRSLERWAKPSATATGTIVVTVRVDREGRVTSASYSSGTGAVASLTAARRSCEQAALKSQFSVVLDGPATQVGTITYRFK